MERKMEASPQVSIIIPAFNAASTIIKAVESVLSQSYCNFELIIIDDGSTDSTLKVVNSLTDSRIKIFTQTNAGVSSARNKGIFLSRGNLIAFLDADDVWLPKKLEIQLDYFEKKPYLDFLSGSAIYKYNKKYQYRKSKCLEGNVFNKLLSGNYILTSSVMFKKKIAKNIKMFNEDITLGEDWDFWLRLSLKNYFLTISDPLVLYEVHNPKKYSIRLLRKDRGLILRSLLDSDHNCQKKIYRYKIKSIWNSNTSFSMALKFWGEKKPLSCFQFVVKGFFLNPFNFKKVISLGHTILIKKN